MVIWMMILVSQSQKSGGEAVPWKAVRLAQLGTGPLFGKGPHGIAQPRGTGQGTEDGWFPSRNCRASVPSIGWIYVSGSPGPLDWRR